jgi:hypothetical protein
MFFYNKDGTIPKVIVKISFEDHIDHFLIERREYIITIMMNKAVHNYNMH